MLGIAVLLTLFGWAGILLPLQNFSAAFFDNLHWTAGYGAGALLAWWRYFEKHDAYRNSVKWFALGLTSLTIAQVIWAIQVWVQWMPFPGPSDPFFLALGAAVFVGLWQQGRTRLGIADWRSAQLDAAILMIATLTASAVLYLPDRGEFTLLQIITIIGYPVIMAFPAILALIMALATRARINWKFVLLPIAMTAFAYLWMKWNLWFLHERLQDGAWLNIGFSVVAIGIGIGAYHFEIKIDDRKNWDRFCESSLRLLPIIEVIFAAFGVVIISTLPTMDNNLKISVVAGSLIVVALATLRQALRLHEYDLLHAAKKLVQERESELESLMLEQKAILDNQGTGIMRLKGKKFVWVNRATEEILGYESGELEGQPFWLLYANEETMPDYCQRVDAVTYGGGTYRGEFEAVRKNGATIWAEVSFSPLPKSEGEVIGTLTDITERKLAEKKIMELAFYDPLTMLPNRRLLLDRLNQGLANSARTGKYGALMLLDLDNFKILNDTRGHDVGDKLLVAVAKQLQAVLRESDTAARLGGDEFVVLLEDIAKEEQDAALVAEMLAEKIRTALTQLCPFDSLECNIGVCIGISLLHGHDKTFETIMKQADLALYEAKRSGRNVIHFFDPVMQEAVDRQVQLESGLRKAISANELVLYYQPQMDQDGKMIGVEALLRWLPEGKPMISPAEFVPIAERSGLMVSIGYWVLETACRQIVTWSADPALANLQVSVNTCASQFRQSDFVEQVGAIVAETKVDSSRLKLELTESAMVENVEQVIKDMHAIRALGVTFAMDDFGTGYSSLASLKRLPIDQLKIDQSFVRDLPGDSEACAVAQTIIALGKSLHMQVIAEGVETESQRDFLAANDCLLYQGYLFSHPVPAQQIEGLLQ